MGIFLPKIKPDLTWIIHILQISDREIEAVMAAVFQNASSLRERRRQTRTP